MVRQVWGDPGVKVWLWGQSPWSHQQLLWDELHDQLLGPLVRLPAGGVRQKPFPAS